MFKMRYFNNKFLKIAKRWRLCSPSAPLTSDFGDLVTCNCVICPKVFFKRIVAKSNLKKSVMTLFQWRHRYYDTKNVTKLTSQDFSILDLFQSKFLATPVPFCHTLQLWFQHQ